MSLRIVCMAAAIAVIALPALADTKPAKPVAPIAPVAPVAPTPVVPLQITVYDQNDFKGRSITIDKAVPDLSVLHFDNKVASLQIRGAGDWVLCENKNYQGRCARVQLQAGNLKLFGLNDRVSSLYPAPTPAVEPGTTQPNQYQQ